MPAPVAPEIANIPAEFNGSIAKSTSTAPSIEVRFFNRIAQSAFEKIYQVEMPEELTDLFQEAYLAATRKEEEEE